MGWKVTVAYMEKYLINLMDRANARVDPSVPGKNDFYIIYYKKNIWAFVI